MLKKGVSIIAYDGSIKIDTSIDTSGFSSGISKLQSIAQGGVSLLTNIFAGVTTAVIAGGTASTKVGSSFEAAMSKVSAISGATGDDLNSLTEKAKEMGAKTKFSASESAEALQYMAMAGWDTNDMLDGIEGIMNLAAADGLDLASTSDIVTDAITAFGLEAKDSGDFADVLAKASSSANTNVSMLGESFKYVAPLAGTMGYSVEDVSTALGLMANASVKGSMAGTSLKTALSNLAAPTKKMRNALQELGLASEQTSTKFDQSKINDAISKQENATSKLEIAQQKYSEAVEKYGENSTQAKSASVNLTTAQQNLTKAEENLAEAQAGTEEQTGFMVTAMQNADGTTKPLKETLVELRSAFSGLDEAQQAQYASIIFGKEAMSGMLAIINASDEDFNKLTEEINNSDESAKNMAETMQDNLQGQITILKSALEGLGIEIYGSMQEPLKDAAVEGQNYVNRLTEAFKDEGLNGLISEAGDIFAELATKAAEAAPKMIDASVEFIKSFVKGIQGNSNQLKSAAKEIVNAISNGLVSLLPSEIQKPVKNAIKEIQKSFESGGLKKAINTVKTAIERCGEVITDIVKVVLPPFVKIVDGLAGNLNTIVPVIAACAAAYKGWQIVGAITSLITAHTVAVTTETLAENAAAISAGTATAAYSAKSVIVGVLTGNVTLATAAQYLWNAALNANPIAIVVMAVAALAGGIAALCLTQDDEVALSEDVIKQNEKIASAYSNAFDAAKNFQDGVDSATGILNGFNDSIVMSDDKQKELQDEMQTTQDKISEIASLASDERRQLTDEEVKSLEQLFKKEQELAKKQLSVKSNYQTVLKGMAEDLSKDKDMGVDEYEAEAQKYLKSAQETRDAVVETAHQQRINILAEKKN